MSNAFCGSVFVAVWLAVKALYPANGATVTCVSGAQLAAAMVDDNVDTVLLPSNVALEQEDFTGYTVPIVIKRNFTILGTGERLVTFDMALLRDKARMGNGTTMTLRRVLTQTSTTTTFQTNGLDLMAPMPPNEQATIWGDQGAGLREACMQREQTLIAVKSPLGSRPPTIPGTNVYEIPVALPPGCVNSSTAPLLDRCYAYAYRAVDVALYGATVRGPNGRVVPNGYLVRATNWISLCVSVFPAECFERLNAPGCGVAFTSRPPPALDPVVNGGAAGGGLSNATGNVSGEGTSIGGGLQGGNSRERKRVLALGLGCGLGGAVVGAIVLVLLFGFRTNERAQERSACAQKASTIATSAPGEASCAADHSGPHDTTGGVQPADRKRKPATAANSHHAAGSDGCINGGTSGVIASGDSPAPGPTHSHSVAPRLQGARVAGTTAGGWGHRQHELVSPFTPMRQSLELKAKLIPAALALMAPTPTQSQPGRGHAPATASPAIDTISDKDGGEVGDGAKAAAAPAAGGAARGGHNVATPGGDTDVVTLLPTVLGKGACGRVQEGLYRGQRVAVKVMLTEEGWNSAPGGGFGGWRGGGGGGPGDGHGLNGPTPLSPAKQPQQLASAAEAAASEHVTPLFPAARVEAERQPPSPSARGVEQSRSASLGVSLDLPVRSIPANISCDAEGTLGGQEGGGDDVPHKAGVDLFEDKEARLLATEVEVLGRCDHPNVVRLLAACLTPPRMCLVMELCQTSLERMIYGGGTLIPLPKLLHIGIQICQGLEYLHPTIVHRDLKPGNVLINGADMDRPVAKLADFGFSRIRAMTQSTQNPEVGTPAYIAPECYNPTNNVVLHHADMYSLGVLLWAMLTGQHPWQDYTVAAVAFKVAAKNERLPLEHLPESRCPPKLRNFIQQCWDADPQRRPAAAEAVKQLTLVQQLASAPSGGAAGGQHFSGGHLHGRGGATEMSVIVL